METKALKWDVIFIIVLSGFLILLSAIDRMEILIKMPFIRETQISGVNELKFVSRTIPMESEGIIGFAELRFAPVPRSPA